MEMQEKVDLAKQIAKVPTEVERDEVLLLAGEFITVAGEPCPEPETQESKRRGRPRGKPQPVAEKAQPGHVVDKALARDLDPLNLPDV